MDEQPVNARDSQAEPPLMHLHTLPSMKRAGEAGLRARAQGLDGLA
jgi:hypothetical protein